MTVSVTSSISALYVQNYLNQARANLQRNQSQNASGAAINSGADNPAAISMIDQMQASDASLAQQQTNDAITAGGDQVASGALSQENGLLDQGVTLSTEAANGVLTPAQDSALNLQYQSLLAEAGNIESATGYNGSSVFAAGADSSSLDALNGSLGSTDLSTPDAAQGALTALDGAVSGVSQLAGSFGAQINALNSSSSVASAQQTETEGALNAIQATNYAQSSMDLANNGALYKSNFALLA
jgi:flagellin